MEQKLREHIERRVPLTDNEFAFVLTHFTVKTCRKHEFLIREGQTVTDSFFVVSGLLKLTYADEAGKQHIVSFAMEDWWESDFQAYFARTKATLSLDCLEDTVVYCLSLDKFNALRAALPTFDQFFMKLSIAGSMAAQQRILSLLTTQAKERYEHLIRQSPSLIQRVPKTLLASYLGVSRETLSRLSA